MPCPLPRPNVLSHRTARRALVAALVLGSAPLAAQDWGDARRPVPGRPAVYGEYALGCIAGATALPLQGEGYEVVRVSRRRYFGHPDTIAYLQDLGHRVAAERLGLMLIGDVSQPRGGPMRSGHASHQTGLDVDVWYRLDLPPSPASRREHLELPSLVDPQTGRVDPQRWSAAHTSLVRLAANDPRVARIFVHPAVKLALCESAGSDRAWLRRVRPWYGHDEHFHVRLECPRGTPGCVSQSAPPEGDGCDAELRTWLEPATRPQPSRRPSRPRPLPAACTEVLAAPSAPTPRAPAAS